MLRPESIEEAIQAVRELQGVPTLVKCGGSARNRGVSPGETEACLDLSSLNKITRLDPDDLSCGVQAGVSMKELEEALAPHGLALESGPFAPSPSTGAMGSRSIGGVLAEAPPAPRSFDRGRLRSQLIGLFAVDGHGRSFKAGGRVVKNVAGYDLCKLFVGSGGAFFVGLEFQLRLIALPARIVLLTSPPFGLEEGIAKWRELRKNLPTPRAMDLVFEENSCRIELLLGGSSAYVESQIRRTGFEPRLEGEAAWKGIGKEGADFEGTVFRGSCLPSRLSAWLQEGPLRGRIHYQGAFAWDRVPGGAPPEGILVHPTQLGGTQVPGTPPRDPGARRIAMELKRSFGGGLMPERLSFLTSAASMERSKEERS